MIFKEKPFDEARVLDALKDVHDPDTGVDIVSAGMVSGVQISGGGVVFMIIVYPARGGELESLRQKAERVVANIKGVQKVSAVLTAERTAQPVKPSKRGARDPHGMEKNPKLSLNVRKIVAVASGKGGVGKSTVAAAIARKLAFNSQLKVGLLDADIYGPSQPKLMGLERHKPQFNDEKMIVPPRVQIEGNAYGLKVMSIGFMVDASKALVWRGPMVQSALYQLFRDVQWAGGADSDDEPLDILIVDMPPGTGDAQLTLAQKVAVDGVIIVSTPQDIALADARKGVEMFRAVDVPILGMIENMSTHICTSCGHEEHIFGHGGARREAEAMGVPFLGEVPLSAYIRERADAGEGFDLDIDISSILLDL